MFALSTSWNSSARNSGKKIVDEIKSLGFNCLELGFSHTKKQIIQINNYHQRFRIISLHNYCPIPVGLSRKKALPDCYSLSSADEHQRKKAVKFTKRSILFAKKLRAKAVVVHMGRVEIKDFTRELIKLKQNSLRHSCQFESVKEFAIRQRESNKELHLEQVIKSLKDLSNFAHNLGICLGIENRFYIREIPNFEELELLLENFKKRSVFYWHDVGHAYVLDRLGFTKQLDYLRQYHKYLLGIHLHDVKEFTDHLAPFCGEIDFKQFKPYINKNTIKVIEAHKPATAEEIIQARVKLKNIFSDN